MHTKLKKYLRITCYQLENITKDIEIIRKRLPSSFYEVKIILISKPDKHTMKERKS